MENFMAKRSLRSRLISIFILTSTVPLLCVGIFLSYHTVRLMRENTRMLTQQNLKQIDDNMNILLESYEDLVYQIYTDDSVVEWMNYLNFRDYLSADKRAASEYDALKSQLAEQYPGRYDEELDQIIRRSEKIRRRKTEKPGIRTKKKSAGEDK